MVKNNRGFTMVELLIVVAIIAVLSGITAMSLSVVSSSDVRETTGDIYSLISRCKVETLSGKVSPQLVISFDATEGAYYGTIHIEGVANARERVGEAGMTIGHTVSSSATVHNVTAEVPLTITFNRETGAVSSPIGINSVIVTAGNSTGTIGITASTGYIEITS